MTLGLDIGNKNRCSAVTTRGGEPVSNHRTDVLANWIASGHTTFRFRCERDRASAFRTDEWVTPGRVRNDEHVSISTIRGYVNFPNLPATKYKYATNSEKRNIGNIIRCDSAWYISYQSGGCVFYKTKPAIKWTYTATSQRGRVWQMRQAYQHYWNACVDPGGETWPDKDNKFIFGCDVNGHAVYMHRETDLQRNRNQDNTNTRCHRMWPGYTEPGQQCDEFPFASTRERTIAPIDRDFSLCPIAGTQNEDAGQYLRRFYNADRVLISDQFTNRFDTRFNDPPVSRENLCGVPTVPN